MPTHVFEAKDGTRVERWYEMSATKNPPRTITVKGKRYVRQFGAGSMVSVEKNYVARGYQFDDDDAQLARKVGAHVDDQGILLDSKKKIRAFQDQMHKKSQGKADWQYEFGIHNK